MLTLFKGMNVTVMGRSHEENGTVCQDSSGYAVYPNYAISIVADGHGSKKHFRSDVGSNLAVKSSIEAMADFLGDFNSFVKNFKESPDKVLKMIQKNIISRWNDKIMQHYNNTPVTDKEKSLFPTEEEFKDIKIESYYGTTLIIGVMCANFSFGLQIGDGSLVLINENGKVEMPIVDDETHPANITASMCNSNAIDLFNSFYTFTRPTALLTSTDGLYTSFESRGSFEEYNLIAISMLENVQEAEDSIKSNLSKRTKYGSRDDISLSIVFEEKRRKACQEFIQQTIEDMRETSKVEKMRQKASLKKQMAKNHLADEDEEY
jgi:hypothetical protein